MQRVLKKLKKSYMADPLFKQYKQLSSLFYTYMHRMVILSCNGQKYDLHLLNSALVKYLLNKERQSGGRREGGDAEIVYESEDEFTLINDVDVEMLDELSIECCIEELKLEDVGETRVIKRANAYVSISNNHIWTSTMFYCQTVATYVTTGEKSCFQYEHVTSFERLSNPLPPYLSDSWRSRLKGGIDMLDEEYKEYLRDPD